MKEDFLNVGLSPVYSITSSMGYRSATPMSSSRTIFHMAFREG